MVRVIGLDLSLTSTGMAFIDYGLLAGVDRIKTTGKKGDDLAARQKRLNGIQQEVFEAVNNYEPHLVVVEAPSYGSQHGAQHDRSGLWWLVVDMLHEMDLHVATVSPNGRAKYGTGKGNAGKDEVLSQVVRRYSSAEVDIRDNNEADAVILAAMGARRLGEPIDGDLPKTHLAAMDGAAWPVGI